MKRAHLQADALSAISYIERLAVALAAQGEISAARRIRRAQLEVWRLLTPKSSKLLTHGVRVAMECG